MSLYGRVDSTANQTAVGLTIGNSGGSVTKTIVFCDETEAEHQDTLSLLEYVGYEQAFLFAYSMRDKTYASRAMQDNVAADIKQRRLQELIDVYRERIHSKNERDEIGQLRLVLVEGPTKKQRSDLKIGTTTWHGRTDQNKRILFDVENDVFF